MSPLFGTVFKVVHSLVMPSMCATDIILYVLDGNKEDFQSKHIGMSNNYFFISLMQYFFPFVVKKFKLRKENSSMSSTYTARKFNC